MHFLRVHVFRQTQRQFAAMAGVAQGTVSKWELPSDNPLHSEPSLGELRRIRSEGIKRKRAGKRQKHFLPWRDDWLFMNPQQTLKEAQRAQQKSNRQP